MRNLLFFILILFLQRIPLYSQSAPNSVQTMDEILKLKWTHEIGKWSPYDGQPLIYEGMLFPYQSVNYALRAETGEKVYYAFEEMREAIGKGRDSLVFFTNFHKNKQMTEHRAVNVNNGKVLIDKPTDRFIYIGYSAPSVIKDHVVFFPESRNKMVAIDVNTSETIWQYTTETPICTQPTVQGNFIYFSDQQTLYALDKDTGIEEWKMKLGEIVSSLEIEDRHAYLWVKPMGLIALNLDSQSVEWAFNAVPAQSNNYNLLVEGDTVFFSSKSVFAVDKKSGSLIWQSEYEDSKSGVHITVLNNYVLYYDMETDDEVPPLTAIDKQTGKVLYQYFTSETYPQDFENERGLNSLDYATMKFVRGAYENMIFGTYHDKIYAFEILKRQ